MYIKPTKEHYEIVTTLGSKILLGIVSVNGAAALALISLYGNLKASRDEISNAILLSIGFLVSGAILGILAGKQVMDIFLLYQPGKSGYEIKNNEEIEKGIKLCNNLAELAAVFAVILPLISSIIILYRSQITSPTMVLISLAVLWIILGLLAYFCRK